MGLLLRFLVLAVTFFSFTAVAAAGTSADLAITNPSVAPGAHVGDSATYTVQVSNNGADAVDATVTDQLGDAEELVSVTTSAGSCTSAPPVTCSVGTLAPG